MAALLFDLAENGKLVLDVPAGEWAYSEYDHPAGHGRRDSIRMPQETAARRYLQAHKWSYWGLSLVPTLPPRKFRLGARGTREE